MDSYRYAGRDYDAALESVEEIADALIVNLDLPGGGFFMPLFAQ